MAQVNVGGSIQKKGKRKLMQMPFKNARGKGRNSRWGIRSLL